MLLMDEIAGEAAREVGRAPVGRLTISVRELLHMRVELEWQERSTRAAPTPGSVEARLNPAGLRGLFDPTGTGPETARLTRMCAAAEQAFLDQQIFVLLDDSQALSLDQVVDVERTAAATFLLLTPLRGG